MIPLSVVIITKNAERHLARVLAAVAWCDDIVVVDSGSADQTLAIAQAQAVRVVHQEWLGFGAQKRAAVAVAKHDWILSLDADEILPANGEAIIRSLDLSDAQRCWRLPRITWVGNRACRHGIFANDAPIRLFNRTTTNFTVVAVHESVLPTRQVLTLPVALDHHSFADCAELFERMARYSRPKAHRIRGTGRRHGAIILAARAGWAFAKTYVFKGGFRDGAPGLCACLSAAADAVVGHADAVVGSPASPSGHISDRRS